MIHTVTLNPAIDRTLVVPRLRLDAVNRAAESRLDPGGKGFNVARAIRQLGGRALAWGIVGGSAGDWLAARLAEAGLALELVRCPGETRTNTKLVDPVSGTQTDINEAGPPVGERELRELEDRLFATAAPGDFLVLTGSIGTGVPSDIYARWIVRARASGIRTLIDADGEALRHGVAAFPDLVKPNQEELGRLVGRDIATAADALSAARGLIGAGVGRVVVSLGPNGAVFAQADQAWLADGLVVEARNTVGAGDAMLAALAAAWEAGADLQGLISPAVAAGTAAVESPGTGFDDPARVAFHQPRVTWRPA